MRTWFPIAALLLTGWFAGGAALAQPSKTARTVQDDLSMFSAEAKTKANTAIASIKRTHQKDLMIETTRPPKQPKDLDLSDNAAVDKFIDGWVKEKFKNEQINGVHVLFIEQAKLRKLRVAVGPETLRTGMFTNTNRDELIKTITEKMKAGDKDGALLAATGYVADALQRNGRGSVSPVPPANAPPEAARPEQAAEASPIMRWVLIGLGVLLVFWIVSAIIRGFSAMGGGGGYGYGQPGYGPGYGGGGGFMSGMLGGLFGAAAGMWAYNHFFGGGGSSAYGGSSGYAGSAPAQPNDVGAGDPSVGGADYGNVDPGPAPDPGGGDWGGGGDAGGGDWGGGGSDVGGGGGDWGGGGGDFGGGGGGGDW